MLEKLSQLFARGRRNPKLRASVLVLLKVFLLVVIPAFTVGLNIFEKTPVYASLLGVKGPESVLAERLTTQYGEAKKAVIDRSDSEFEDLVHVIRKFSAAKLPDGLPILISRLAVEHGASVTVPEREKPVVLIPESVPIYFFYSSEGEGANALLNASNAFRVGSVGELRGWLEQKRRGVRDLVDLVVFVTSVLIGLFVEFAVPKSREGD